MFSRPLLAAWCRGVPAWRADDTNTKIKNTLYQDQEGLKLQTHSLIKRKGRVFYRVPGR